MFRCDCGSQRCKEKVSRSTWFRHRLDRILVEHNNAANNAPLPVEDAPPVDDHVRKHAPAANPEVHMLHFHVPGPMDFLCATIIS